MHWSSRVSKIFCLTLQVLCVLFRGTVTWSFPPSLTATERTQPAGSKLTMFQVDNTFEGTYTCTVANTTDINIHLAMLTVISESMMGSVHNFVCLFVWLTSIPISIRTYIFNQIQHTRNYIQLQLHLNLTCGWLGQ